MAEKNKRFLPVSFNYQSEFGGPLLAEHRTAYPVKEPNPAGIPARWLRFLYRVAGLERGRIYTVTVIVPHDADSEPQWAISDGAKVENVR